MMHATQIRNALSETPSDLGDKIARFMIGFSVCLFAVDASGSSLKLAGTGSLVTVRGRHYILTANHVWTEKLASATLVMIPLTEQAKNTFNIPVKAIEPIAMPRSYPYSEWGPDLVLLRLPSAYIGTIESRRVFFNLDLARTKALSREHLECWMLMGTPAEQSTFGENFADVSLLGLLAFDSSAHQKDGLDYLDLPVTFGNPWVPKNFGGVSGGGLWKLLVYWSEESNEVEWVYDLQGVAFYQFPIDDETTKIRCNGPDTIKAVVNLVNGNPV